MQVVHRAYLEKQGGKSCRSCRGENEEEGQEMAPCQGKDHTGAECPGEACCNHFSHTRYLGGMPKEDLRNAAAIPNQEAWIFLLSRSKCLYGPCPP